MKYLILGSNSFAGSTLVNYLLEREYTVIGISRSQNVNPILLAYVKNKNIKNFTFYGYDINHDFEVLCELIRREKPSIIVDFAGQGMVAESWYSPEQWYQTNIVSKVKLHNFLRNCDFLDRYVRVSTPEVYGNTDFPVDENQVFNPSTPYAVSHAAIDMSLKAFYHQYQFPMVLTRFANFYGPHQQLYRIIPRTIIYALTGQKLSLHGGGVSKRAFIYGDDVSKAIECVAEKGQCGETYHFSSENPITIAELVKNICALIDVRFETFVVMTQDRPGKDAKYEMSVVKSKTDLGFEAKTNLMTGIENTITWVRQNLSIIKTLPLNYIHQP